MVYSSLSIQLFCAHKGLYCSPFKDSLANYSKYNGLRDSLIFSQRKYDAFEHRCVFYQGGFFTRMPYNYEWHSGNKMSRSIKVRSEIAGTGSSAAAYQLPELKLASKVRGICFYAITSSVAIFLFVLMLVGHPFVLLLDRYRRRYHHLIAKIWASMTVAPFFKIKIKGLENLPPHDSPAVYVSNHQSFLDIYALLTLGRSFKFISKTSIFLFPVVGWAMFLMGLIPLKRMDRRSHFQTLKRCTELVKKGGSVFFFPEGTRSKDGSLGAFKKGAFSLAAKAGVPVVPITLIGTGNIMPSGMEGRVNTGSVEVVIHQSVKGDNGDILCDDVRGIIADELNRHG